MEINSLSVTGIEDWVLESRKSVPYSVGKRAMDLAFSLIAVVILIPLSGAIAIAIKVSSRGPVLFKQKRVGKGGKEFIFYKFRSMYADSDQSLHQGFIKRLMNNEAKVFKLKNDPRITLVGRIIRRASIDELPQLINVIKGDMSIVGPRPYPTYEAAKWKEWHKRRLLVTPGITGLWQVEGRGRVPYDEGILMDVKYVENASVWLDFKILLKTIPAVLSLNGAH